MVEMITSPLLGDIEVDENKVINFPRGMIGFSDYKKYLLLEDGEVPFWYLQSIEKEELFFVLIDPVKFFTGYTVEVEKETLKEIELDSLEDGAVLTPVTIPEEGVNKATANLQGPVIINTKKGLAMQLVLHPSEYTTKHPLFNETKKASGED